MNKSALEGNVTLQKIASALNLNITHSLNDSEHAVTPEKLLSLHEAYTTRERDYILAYRSVGYVLGTLIILSNLTVVISSGLILRKGQQPKSTYLLLGNVSLADTIIGIAIVFGAFIDNTVNSNVLCQFQLGMIVCPIMVSIFSVGFIAIDRYIYIIHGLYYQRWINTTRVRIGILIIWVFSLILSYAPSTGWRNQDLSFARCNYISVFPTKLIFVNSVLSIVTVAMVAVLYGIILVSAIKNSGKIKSAEKQIGQISPADEPKLRSHRRSLKDSNIKNMMAKNHGSIKFPAKNNKSCGLPKSASTSELHNGKLEGESLYGKSKSLDVLHDDGKEHNTNAAKKAADGVGLKLSVFCVESDHKSSSSYQNFSASVKACSSKIQNCKAKLVAKSKQPSKARAVIVVMLTSGSFIVTWMPVFIVLNLYVFCESKLANPRCLNLRTLLGGPLATLVFLNSVLNPLIYAWWHRGFKNAVKDHIKRFYIKKRSFSNLLAKGVC